MPGPAGHEIGMPYRCLACGADLVREDRTLRCSSCDAAHPLLAGELPVLVPAPVRYLARNLVTLRRIGTATGSASEAAHADALIGMARANVTARDLARAVAAREPGDDTWSGGASLTMARTYLRRDWSGLPESEQEVSTTMAAIRRQIAGHCEERDAVAVIGAGLGRHAWELRDDFAEVHAIDHSYAMCGTLQLLRAGELDVELVDQHVVLAEHERISFRARLPDESGVSGRFFPAIADVRALPFVPGSFDCVVCVFPSLPAAELAAHAFHMLRPGGVFVHFGPPLGSVEGARTALTTAGFELLGEEFVDTALASSPASLHTSLWRSWSVAARKLSAVAVADDAAPALAEATAFEVFCTVSAESHVNHMAELRHPRLGSAKVGEPLFSFLMRLDGERTVAEILDELAGHGLASEDAEQLLRSPALGHLVAAGLVRTQP